MGPVEQASGKAVVLGGDEDFPNAFFGREEGASVADEVAEEMFLEMNLGVGRVGSAKAIEAGEKLIFVSGDAAEDGVLAETSAGAVGLVRSGAFEQFAERIDNAGLDPHTQG